MLAGEKAASLVSEKRGVAPFSATSVYKGTSWDYIHYIHLGFFGG